jgi:hypothetical protein
VGGIVGNRAIESAAIQWIIKLEGAAGRAALDTRGGGGVADITSPPRTIEVKAFGGVARGQDLWLETTQVNAALADTDFWVYVVENIAQGDPAEFRLAMIGGQRLAALLRRRRERHYFEVPWPVADYDTDPPRAMNPLDQRLRGLLSEIASVPTRRKHRMTWPTGSDESRPRTRATQDSGFGPLAFLAHGNGARIGDR